MWLAHGEALVVDLYSSDPYGAHVRAVRDVLAPEDIDWDATMRIVTAPAQLAASG